MSSASAQFSATLSTNSDTFLAHLWPDPSLLVLKCEVSIRNEDDSHRHGRCN